MTDAHFSMKRKIPCENMSDEIGPLYHSSLFAKCETNHIRFSKCFCMNYTKTSWLYRIQQILTEWKFSIYFFAVFVNEIHYVCVTIFGIQREREREKQRKACIHAHFLLKSALPHPHSHPHPIEFPSDNHKRNIGLILFRLLLSYAIMLSYLFFILLSA